MVQMLSHGINVVGLFFVLDIISSRLKTNKIEELGGLAKVAPQLAIVFLIILLGAAITRFVSFEGLMVIKEGTSKNWFKHLHDTSIKMFLFASALDNEEIPDEPIDSCKRIINSKTVALAEQELNNQFESHGLNEVSFSPGYIVNVFTGSMIWASSDTPSNQSPFSFAEVEPIRAAKQKNHHLTLQLILTQGRGMSVEEIKASNKQEVHPPMNFHELQEQLLMFTVASPLSFLAN